MNILKTIRIDHIGSLVRPATLKDIFARYDRGQVSREELGKVQDEAIRNVIQKQKAHGFPIVTDGEFRRHSFQESFSECVIGFDVPKNASLYYEKRDVNETLSNGRNRISTKLTGYRHAARRRRTTEASPQFSVGRIPICPERS
jgi:methionine synthase II (cobalamin-independent)